MASNLALDNRIAVAAGFVLFGLSAALSAAVGLPLFGDGALYFLEIVLEREPLVPNQRFGALIPQLPLVLATALTDQVAILRHVFGFAYGLMPFLSALACWLIVRHREPELVVFPALFLAANQINFSAVSELLLCLYLGWPFLLYACLRPSGTKLGILGLMLAPLLFFLHPLAFLLLLFLGACLLFLERTSGMASWRWGSLAALFLGLGLLRLLWSALAVNADERSHLDSELAAYYLFPASVAQTGLLCATLLLGLAMAARLARLPSTASRAADHASSSILAIRVQINRLSRLLAAPAFPLLIGALTAVLAVGVTMEIQAGGGIKLKSAAVFPLALALMAMAVLVARSTRAQRRQATWAPLFLLLCLVATAVNLSKAQVWSRATADLGAAMASSQTACVRFGPEEPQALQHAHMSPIDNWTAPINALIFQTEKPAALLLPEDGCRILAEEQVANLTSWFGRPLGVLEPQFGPFRVDQR